MLLSSFFVTLTMPRRRIASKLESNSCDKFELQFFNGCRIGAAQKLKCWFCSTHNTFSSHTIIGFCFHLYVFGFTTERVLTYCANGTNFAIWKVPSDLGNMCYCVVNLGTKKIANSVSYKILKNNISLKWITNRVFLQWNTAICDAKRNMTNDAYRHPAEQTLSMKQQN